MKRSKLENIAISLSTRQHGFTLLDALVTIAIVTILTAVAFPSYQAMAKQGIRGDGVSTLQEVMQHQERFFLNNMTYTTDLTALGYDTSPLVSDDEYYSVAASVCGGSIARCVQLTATPRGSHAGDGAITLDSAGNKGAAGDALAADIWGHK